MRKIPCYYPVSRVFGNRDGFARDWLLRHPVCLCPSLLGSPLNSAAFRAVSEAKRTGEGAGLGRIRPEWHRFLCSAMTWYGSRVPGRSVAEEPLLVIPVQRQFDLAGEPRDAEVDGLLAVKNRFDNAGGQEGEADQPPDIPLGD